jgi:hypothetical protein
MLAESPTPVAIPAPIATACPLCGQPSISTIARQVRGVNLADLMCAQSHAWFCKWLPA